MLVDLKYYNVYENTLKYYGDGSMDVHNLFDLVNEASSWDGFLGNSSVPEDYTAFDGMLSLADALDLDWNKYQTPDDLLWEIEDRL